MKKRWAFFTALIFTVIILFILYPSSNFQTGTIARVIDGDTILLADGTSIRLLNINSPEKDSPLFLASSFYLRNYENKTIQFETFGKDKYSRTLARIYTPDYLNLELVKLGLATKFMVHESELSSYSQAESQAIENSRGIWKKSPFFNCVKIILNKEAESILLTKQCKNFSLSDSYIRDESRKEYFFKTDFSSPINLFSGEGMDNSTAIFWNSKTPIWNDDRDTIYLLDKNNEVVYYESYGY
jgi:micrococcal nuclease